MKRTRGFTLIELMVVVGIIGILAAVAIPTLRSATQNAKVSSSSFDLQLRLAGLRTKALAEQDVLVAVLVDAAGNKGANCQLGRWSDCATLFVLRNPTSAWTLSAFDPATPATNAEIIDTRALGRGIRFATERTAASAPIPFNTLKAFASEQTGTCGGRACMAIRYSTNGRVSAEIVGSPTAVPKGLVFALGSDAELTGLGGERRGVLVAFPSGIVKGFPL